VKGDLGAREGTPEVYGNVVSHDLAQFGSIVRDDSLFTLLGAEHR
jgi:hypothetical protein